MLQLEDLNICVSAGYFFGKQKVCLYNQKTKLQRTRLQRNYKILNVKLHLPQLRINDDIIT